MGALRWGLGCRETQVGFLGPSSSSRTRWLSALGTRDPAGVSLDPQDGATVAAAPTGPGSGGGGQSQEATGENQEACGSWAGGVEL